MRPPAALAALFLLSGGLLAGGRAAAARLADDVSCRVGVYDAPGRPHLTVTALEKGRLGYLMGDERGALDPVGPGAFAQGPPRPPVQLRFDGCAPEVRADFAGTEVRFRRRAFRETPLSIDSGGLTLDARLVAPLTGKVSAYAIFVDGSDQTGAVGKTYWQYELPLRGVGVLVLDKRGTGGSGGQPTANFHLRADDVIAAVRRLRSLAGPTARLGLAGFSQGGWVAPLAASREPVDFVMVGYGMAEGVTDEDREEIIQNLREAGFGPTDIAQATELQAAAAAVVRSHWTTGWEAFDAVKAKYAQAAWIKAMGQDGFTSLMVAAPTPLVRQLGPKTDFGVSFEYDPAPVIAALKTRQLWVLGGDDHGAPSARTIEILRRLQASNPALDVAVFPKADHGIVETATEHGVTRVRLAAGYLDLVAGWIRSGRMPATPGARLWSGRR